jgi:malate dehydrogenase (oxaloacetate-decarboxylating)(NADP+)
MNALGLIFRKLQKDATKKRVIFAEGEEVEVVRSAMYLAENGYCKPILIGREEKVKNVLLSLGITDLKNVEIANASLMQEKLPEFIELLYKNLQRKGYLKRDCERLVKTDRNIFGACLLETGHGDAMMTGYTRGFRKCFSDVRSVISVKKEGLVSGFSIISGADKTILIGDTAVNENPTAEELAKIALMLASQARLLNLEPKVAFISYSSFGSREGEHINVIKDAIKILDSKKTDFEYDGEMMVDVALSENPRKFYPFNKLSGSANILIANNLTTGNVATNLIKLLSTGTSVIGPVIIGFEKPVQIMKFGADFESIVNATVFCIAKL